MSDLSNIGAVLAQCNFHAALYGALGCTLVLGARLARQARKHEEAREQAVHGLVMLLLALL